MNSAVRVGGPLAFVSAALLAFLGLWEGDKQYTVYADKLAQGLPTVCRGLTKHITDTPIIVGERWTEEKCLAEEFKAIQKVQKHLLDCFHVIPPQAVFDSATSHAWNHGVSATCGSQAMAAWNLGLYDLGCKRLHESDSGKPVWSYVKTGRIINGKIEYKFVQGLANRRKAEAAVCLGHTQPETLAND